MTAHLLWGLALWACYGASKIPTMTPPSSSEDLDLSWGLAVATAAIFTIFVCLWHILLPIFLFIDYLNLPKRT